MIKSASQRHFLKDPEVLLKLLLKNAVAFVKFSWFLLTILNVVMLFYVFGVEMFLKHLSQIRQKHT